MKTIGLDLSINSTGVCVCKDGKPVQYYIIASDKSLTKKAQKIISDLPTSAPLKYYIYSKADTKGLDYADKESAKTLNINSICGYISDIVRDEQPDYAFIEGISYGSVGSAALADLSGLNFVTRWVLEMNHIPFIIVAPTENKKNACGNGAANKDEMIYAWLVCDKQLDALSDRLKFDDIADAYFLARTPLINEK